MYSIDKNLVEWSNVYPEKPCIIEAETAKELTYQQCLAAVQEMRQFLGDAPRNVFLTLSSGIVDAVLWLAALRREQITVGTLAFLRVGAIVMPPALLLGLSALTVTTR